MEAAKSSYKYLFTDMWLSQCLSGFHAYSCAGINGVLLMVTSKVQIFSLLTRQAAQCMPTSFGGSSFKKHSAFSSRQLKYLMRQKDVNYLPMFADMLQILM